MMVLWIGLITFQNEWLNPFLDVLDLVAVFSAVIESSRFYQKEKKKWFYICKQHVCVVEPNSNIKNGPKIQI